jgi:hypothetical protein
MEKIMKDPADYLEAAEIERLTNELTAQGYEIVSQSPDEPHFDLLASRSGKTIAFTVKAASRLAQEASHIRQLSNHAIARGYADFRLSVVNPPREKMVEIENLDELLTSYIQSLNSADVVDFPGRVVLGCVSGVQVDALRVKTDKIVVEGSASVDADLYHTEDTAGYAVSLGLRFPFFFTLTLSHDMHIIAEETLLQRIETTGEV